MSSQREDKKHDKAVDMTFPDTKLLKLGRNFWCRTDWSSLERNAYCDGPHRLKPPIRVSCAKKCSQSLGCQFAEPWVLTPCRDWLVTQR
jgi:hypothetical protein